MRLGQSNPEEGGFTPLQPFGRYLLLRRLAVGGMGEVFLGRLEGAEGFERLLVIKRLRPELANDPEFVSRFGDEARTLVRLQHGNIAQVFDHGAVAGNSFIALEFVDGKDLKAVLTRCQERGIRVPTAVALHLAIRVLEALAYAHRKKDEFDRDLNLVHRDISPPNILLAYEGEVKVIDFGLAKSVLSHQRTQAGALLGKLLYMPPEVTQKRPLDRRADLFALGVVLHETLYGRHICEGMVPGEVMATMARPTFPRLAGQPGVSAALDAALQRALEPDPARRFQTAEEMRAPLAACLAELAPSFSSDGVATFMRELFAAEYAQERGELRRLRELAGMRRRTGDHPQPISPVADTEPPWSLSSPVQGGMPATEASAPRPQRPDTLVSDSSARPRTEPVPMVSAGALSAGVDGSARTSQAAVRAIAPGPGEVFVAAARHAAEPPTQVDAAAPVLRASIGADEPEAKTTPGIPADAEPDPEPAQKPSGQRGLWLAVAAMLVIALALGFLAWQRSQSAAQGAGHVGKAGGRLAPARGQLQRGARERQVELPARPR